MTTPGDPLTTMREAVNRYSAMQTAAVEASNTAATNLEPEQSIIDVPLPGGENSAVSPES